MRLNYIIYFICYYKAQTDNSKKNSQLTQEDSFW